MTTEEKLSAERLLFNNQDGDTFQITFKASIISTFSKT